MISELRTVLNQEDLNDDHEAAVPKGVQHVIQTFLETHLAAGRSSRRKAHGRDLIEVFSPPRLTAEAQRRGLNTSEEWAYDLTCGWDCHKSKDRKRLWRDLDRQPARHVVLTPECRMFSVMQNLSKNKRDPDRWKAQMEKAIFQISFCMRLAKHQHKSGGKFIFEQPLSATAWSLKEVRDSASLAGSTWWT